MLQDPDLRSALLSERIPEKADSALGFRVVFTSRSSRFPATGFLVVLRGPRAPAVGVPS